MTRKELANTLMSDETKLDEEVMWLDLEYSRYDEVVVTDSDVMDILSNGGCDFTTTKKISAKRCNRRKNSNNNQMKILQ